MATIFQLLLLASIQYSWRATNGLLEVPLRQILGIKHLLLCAHVVVKALNLKIAACCFADCVNWRNVLKVRAGRVAFSASFRWRGLPNEDVKFSDLRFWQQREPATSNLSSSAFPRWPFVSVKTRHPFCTTWTTWNNHKTLKLTFISNVFDAIAIFISFEGERWSC